MYARPSKNFFFPLLQKNLAEINGRIGIDAASAGMKNRHMFRTKIYLGIDINEDLLKTGLAKCDSEETLGLLADIAKLDSLPANFAAAVVSTNTLYCLPKEKVPETVKSLARLVEPNGLLLYQLTVGANQDFENTVSALKKQFKKVKILYYKNPLSNFYEKFFERDGNLGSHPLAGSKPFLILSYLLSRLEYLTCKTPSLNKEVCVICKNKTGAVTESLVFSKLQKIGDRLYKL